MFFSHYGDLEYYSLKEFLEERFDNLEVEEKFGITIDLQGFPQGTKTAQDAAQAIGCELSQIAKSIAFDADDDIVVVVTSGSNKVSKTKLSKILDKDEEKIEMANPRFVKKRSGWSVGGVPPFCYKENIKVLIDEDLMEYDTIWAAGGTPNTVFTINPNKLKEYSEGEIANVIEG
ncbi:MAG: YbaK/EbsC family protein [Candidatus Aenigmatarchaeota archaeon]